MSGAGYDATARLQAYNLLLAPMLRLPDEVFLAQLTSEEFAGVLHAIGEAVPIPLMAEGLALIKRYTERLAAARNDAEAYDAMVEDLACDRTYLFRALAPDVGAPPPYETQYCDLRSKEAGIGAVAEAYRQAGMEVGDDVHERPDYLGVELAFMAHLIECELAVEAAEEIAALREAQAAFYGDHLGRWASDYVQDALSHARTDFFLGLLMVGQALLEREDAHLRTDDL
ncbi:MAG: molecular chaperone TorD family protein [Adlercreutzia sp.]|nr:molecular chaperone TorD family protein [Adlercreutzia sp.]